MMCRLSGPGPSRRSRDKSMQGSDHEEALLGPFAEAPPIAERAMAGHSQFKNIMHRKGRQDAARSKLFSKLAREITVSAKMGAPDPNMNPRLRAAILAARGEHAEGQHRARHQEEPGGRRRQL